MALLFVFRLNICKSKVLNLLIPLGAKRAGGFESYITSEIFNKYAFLMIFLSILLLLFFSLFGTSKELIGDSERL